MQEEVFAEKFEVWVSKSFFENAKEYDEFFLLFPILEVYKLFFNTSWAKY